MKVKTRETENAVIINLEGEMMLGYEANDFHEAIRLSIEKNKKNIVIDLCEVKFISSWGIGMLIHGLATTTNRGGIFKLVGLADNVMQVFQKVKIDTVLDIYKSVDMAKSG